MSHKSQATSLALSGLKPTPPTSAKSSLFKMGNGDQLKLGSTASSTMLNSSSTSLLSDNSIFATFTQDINMVIQKLSDLSGEIPASNPPAPAAASTFVSGLRSLTSTSTSGSQEDALYSQNMEKLLSKIGELDKLVLKKTAPDLVDGTQLSKRRSSRNADLHHLPTHLHLVDRLLDLYNQSKRVTIIAHGVKVDGNKENGDTKNDKLDYNAVDNIKMRALESEIVTLKQLIGQLQGNEKKNLELSETTEVQMKAYKSQLTSIQAQLKTSQDKVSEQEALLNKAESEKDKDWKDNKSELVNCKNENSALKIEVDKLKVAISHAMSATSSQSSSFSGIQEDLRNQLELANLKIKESESLIRTCEMKLKAEALLNEQIHDVLKAKIESLRANSKFDQILNDSSTVNHDNMKHIQRAHIINYAGYLHLKPETKDLFQSLDEQIRCKLSCVCESASILSSLKEGLEGEIQNYQLERVLLNNDLTSVQNQLMTMKGAYHALETEHVQSTRKILKMSSNLEENSNSSELQKRLDELQETVNHLQNEVLKQARRATQYEKLPLRIAELEMSNSELKSKNVSSETECESLRVELDAYKKLTQSMKDKIKSLGSVGSAAPAPSPSPSTGLQKVIAENYKDREFFDSFEEVMQEEMMTMKTAFEAKLRLAKEEADAATRRHLVEIQRMQGHIGTGLSK